MNKFIICNWCGGITNPTPETGPFKPRQLCDCEVNV